MVNLNKRENISSHAQRSEKMFFNHNFASNLKVLPIIILLFLISSHMWYKHLPEGYSSARINFPLVTDTTKMYSSSIRKHITFQCNKKIKTVCARMERSKSDLRIKCIILSKRNKNSTFSSYVSSCFQSKLCQV